MSSKVLIVDDEPDVTTYLATALRANGYTAAVADCATDGLQVLKELLPDVICLDIMMPRESGLSMYVQLKKHETLKSIPVIIISGVGYDDQWDFRSYIYDESIPAPELFLEKPIDAETFVKAVEQVIASSQARKGSADE